MSEKSHSVHEEHSRLPSGLAFVGWLVGESAFVVFFIRGRMSANFACNAAGFSIAVAVRSLRYGL